jgi:hypothetical protein
MMWWNSDDGAGGATLYIWYNDGNSSQWVAAAASALTGGPYLPLTGGTMTGPLVVPTVPITQNDNTVATTAFVKQLQPLNAKAYGAKGNGVTDDTAALQAWLNSAAPATKLYLPSGVYLTTQPLVAGSGTAALNDVTISGDGPYSSVISYAGTDTTVDILKIGNESAYCENWLIENFRITATTRMTAGTGIHIRRVQLSSVRAVIPDGQVGTGNLWNGIWFDGVGNIDYRSFVARAQNDCLRVNGETGAGAKSGLFVSDAKICLGKVGIHLGGAFGGLYVDNCDLSVNYNNVLIDTALVAEHNREIFFGPTANSDATSLDGATGGDGVVVNDTLGLTFLSLSGTWISSADGYGLHIMPGTSCMCTYDGGVVFNNGKTGILNESVNSTVTIDGVRIMDNGRNGTGYGVDSSVTSPLLQIGPGTSWSSNASGDLGPNVLTSALPLYYGPATWTPGIAFGGASTGLTFSRNFGEYQLIGNMVYTYYSIILTSKGAATGAATMTGLPVQAQSTAPLGALGNASTVITGMAGLSGALVVAANQGATDAVFYMGATTGSAQVLDTNFTNATTLGGQLFYPRAAQAASLLDADSAAALRLWPSMRWFQP